MKALQCRLNSWQSGVLELLLSGVFDGCILHLDSVDQMRIASVVDTRGLREYFGSVIVSSSHSATSSFGAHFSRCTTLPSSLVMVSVLML
jgi:hypothetical protein